MKTLLLALAIFVGGMSNEASAATSYRGRWAAYNPVSTRPMGFFITPDAVVATWWRHWFHRGSDDLADRKVWLRRGR
jgi:hypothetical protein